MKFKTVVYEKSGDVAHVVLNRPEALNAYNVQMRDDLYEVFTAVRDDPEVLVMIVSGSGRAFCAGADLSEFGRAPSPIVARDVRWERDLWGVLKDLDKITIAAMHGHALGSGLEMALFCDLRVAAEGTQFGLPEAALGFIPAAGATQSLPRIVKGGTALAMILACQRINAVEAHRIGLVHRVVAKESLLAEAEGMARSVLKAGPVALALAKEAVNRGLDLSLKEGLALEARLAEFAFATRDAWEGLHARVCGREPKFRGS
ncbi:MAG: enoyl-CoA hydratase/isomerase family protein [Chloroflexi bacterium]|nr:enoyl-CoA hydratase/isomerase family protein [Chloroflexota bacterium]